MVKLSLNDDEKSRLDEAAELRHQQPAEAGRKMVFESVELRKAWNHVYAQRIAEKAGWDYEAALRSAVAADESFKKMTPPSDAADEEMSCWTDGNQQCP